MRTIILPSAFCSKSWGIGRDVVLLDKVFWEKCFSKEFFDLLDLKRDSNMQSFLDFFFENSEFIYEGINKVFSDLEKISELKYYFDIIYTYLVFINSIQENFEISLSHGFISRRHDFFNSIDEIPEDAIYKISEFLLKDYSFSKEDEICFKIYWKNPE